MVSQKRLDYGFNGYQVPSMPQIPKSAKGKRSVRKKTEYNRMCAFDLLAAVAGKLLLEGEISSTPSKVTGTSNPSITKDTIKQEQLIEEKPLKDEAFDLGNCSESTLCSDVVVQRQVSYNPKGCSQAVKSAAQGPAHVFLKSNTSNNNACTERQFPGIEKSYEGKVKDGTVGEKSALDPCSLEDKMDVDAKPYALVSSDSSVEVPLCGDRILHNSFYPKCRDKKLAVDRDDDENSSGCTHPSITTNKTLKPQGIGDRRIRKQLATKFWKVAPTMTKDKELSNTGVEMKPSFHSRKICYTRQRTQRSSFKRRKLFQRCSISTSDGGINSEEKGVSSSANGQLSSYESEDLHVKLSIKSFKVPELFIEIPATSTVGSLKRTVMEAVTAILGGGLHVGVLLQGKKVRDDNKTLLQAGISHGDKLDDLGFTLEPNSNEVPPPLTSTEEPPLLPPCDANEPLTRFSVMVPASDGAKSDFSPESPLIPIVNCPESDHDSVHSPPDTLSLDKTAVNARALIAIPSMSIEALPMVPVRKLRRSELVQRRIRRPFSVSEVEALVHAVEKLGTGRWRDVKLRAFDNAKHRTYVDLKDKWKTLVHTARISPQQRRGEPVPQELLDRVLSAHAYWSQQQAKLQVKSPPAEACQLL